MLLLKLKLDWSLEQINIRMKLAYCSDRVCHETIYSWIYKKDKFSDDETDLYQYLRLGRKRR